MRGTLNPERVGARITEIIELPWPLRLIPHDDAHAQTLGSRLGFINIRGVTPCSDEWIRLTQEFDCFDLTVPRDNSAHALMRRLY
jgi:hypothetical protein